MLSYWLPKFETQHVFSSPKKKGSQKKEIRHEPESKATAHWDKAEGSMETKDENTKMCQRCPKGHVALKVC